MISKEQFIPCPVCQNQIAFDPHELLKGTQFGCSNCGGVIGLAEESRPVVKDTLEKFDEMKANLNKEIK